MLPADDILAGLGLGLEAGNARLGVDVASREQELEEVSDVLLLTEGDDFNALAAFELRQELGHAHVYRLATQANVLDELPAHAEGGVLFDEKLTFAELDRRFEAGAELVELPAATYGVTPLFVVTAAGELSVATAGARPSPSPGDKLVGLRGGAPRPG